MSPSGNFHHIWTSFRFGPPQTLSADEYGNLTRPRTRIERESMDTLGSIPVAGHSILQ